MASFQEGVAERMTQIADDGILCGKRGSISVKLTLAISDNDKDGSMHGYFSVEDSLEVVCLGQRSRAWIGSVMYIWKGRDRF